MNSKYTNSIHFLGRAGSVLSIVIMVGIPAIMCSIYDMWPTVKEFILFSGGLLALYIPTTMTEAITYTPIIGSSIYLAMITGNVSNIKLPCALNAMDVANVEQNTEEGEVVCTVATAVSSIVTSLVVAAGAVLLVPLQPVLSTEPVQIATSYMLPALYGCMLIRLFISNTGNKKLVGKWKIMLLPALIVLLILIFVAKLSRGIAILICIPLIIGVARILYKIGQVRVEPLNAEKENAYNE